MTACKGDFDLLDVARETLDIEIEGIAAVRNQLGEGFTAAVERLGSCTGRVVVTGIGKSGLVGRKIAATFSSTGTPAFFLHPVEGAHGDMGMIREEDVVLAISNSGETDELNAILPSMRTLGTYVVGMTGNPESSLAMLSDAHIQVKVEREACPMNLAPTASTTATLAVGDALAVCLMRRNGFGKHDFKRFHPGGALGKRLSQNVTGLMHCDELPVMAENAPFVDALRTLHDGGFGLAVLTDEQGRLTGVLSDGDVRRLVVGGPLDLQAAAKTFMTRQPKVARADDLAAEVLDLMESHQITVLPVLGDNDHLLGIVHLHDLLGKGRLKFAQG